MNVFLVSSSVLEERKKKKLIKGDKIFKKKMKFSKNEIFVDKNVLNV